MMSFLNKNKVQLIRQYDSMDCGPASLSMITRYFGNSYSLIKLRELCQIDKNGVSMSGIMYAAQKIGLNTKSVRVDLNILLEEFSCPCILFWNKNHFLVLESINRKNSVNKFHVVDPAHGKITLSEKHFLESWLNYDNKGVALFLEPTKVFFENKNQNNLKHRFKPIFKLLIPHKRKILLLFGLVFIVSGLNFCLPFLTEALIDKGVTDKNIRILSLIVLAQLFVFIGIITITVIRNWLTLVIGARLSVDIIYSYLNKILRLPLSFFDTKNSGDFNQRIQDNVKIEQFLTSESILTVFSALTLIIYSIILFYYDYHLFFLYAGLTAVAVIWSLFWLKKRELIDYRLFNARSRSQEAVYEFYNGIKEMKLNQYEEYKKEEWINIQNNLLKINIKSLRVEQYQSIGFSFFNQLKNILVTFLAAYYVIEDIITLGTLLSISFIIGQMNSPIHQLLEFLKSQQDALLSFNRLSEVYTQKEEEYSTQKSLNNKNTLLDITLKKIYFKYNFLNKKYVLENINIKIPKGKVTAIVGHSGSGKTTLMKLLLKFFPPLSGNIYYGTNNINKLSARSIRKNSGIVMQDGYIFSDSIERNIVMNETNICKDKLNRVLKAVNLYDYVNSLALKEKTKIGASGSDLSGGQKQRILIARSIYKDPKYFFFDEATSALDATNEKEVHTNLKKLFKGKTVVIIAHRLSTVQNADQIIVLSNGKVVEKGTHNELILMKSHYYKLVKNQLNL